jgi:hypothetical protein
MVKKRFAEIFDAFDKLGIDEQESLLKILRRRMIENGRQRILADIENVRADYRDGRVRPATVDEIMKEILP